MDMNRMSSTSGRTNGGNGHRHDSREIQREIEETRMEMDHTLDEISERLHPRHLVDVAIDFFRAPSPEEHSPSREYASKAARSVGKQAMRTVRQHPIPALLCGAGIAWLLYEELEREEPDYHSRWADLPEHSGSYVDARTGEPYRRGKNPYARAAWSQGYDWSTSHEDEESWTKRAEHTLAEIRDSISSAGSSASEKLSSIARKMVGLSGRTRDEIHSQWHDLNSGSAAEGALYDEEFGCECDTLYAIDTASSMRWSDQEEKSWSGKAQHMLEEMQQMLSDTGSSVKDRTRALASKLGQFADSTRGMAAGYGRSMGRGAARVGRGFRSAGRGMGRGVSRAGGTTWRGMERAGETARRGFVAAGESLAETYDTSRRQVASAADEYPLAVGAACLGLGLLFGLGMPRTRREDELMGETSDQIKRQVKHRARDLSDEAMQRARHVATATAEAAQEELERQGLSKDTLKENLVEGAKDMLQGAKAVVSRAAETAKEVAAEESGGIITAEGQEVSSDSVNKSTSRIESKGQSKKESSSGGSCDISGRA